MFILYGLCFGSYIGMKGKAKAELMGGLVLVGLGIKSLLGHYFFERLKTTIWTLECVQRSWLFYRGWEGPLFDDGFPKSFLQGIHSKASLGIAVAFGKEILLRTFLWDQVAHGYAKEPYRIP